MKKQGKNIVYGKAVRPNAGIRAWYRSVLRALVDDMTETTKKRLARLYRKYEKQLRPRTAALDANISSRAEAELSGRLGKKLKNDETGIEADFNTSQRNKMLSKAAIEESKKMVFLMRSIVEQPQK